MVVVCGSGTCVSTPYNKSRWQGIAAARSASGGQKPGALTLDDRFGLEQWWCFVLQGWSFGVCFFFGGGGGGFVNLQMYIEEGRRWKI